MDARDGLSMHLKAVEINAKRAEDLNLPLLDGLPDRRELLKGFVARLRALP